jgi:hypothetical protein
MKSAIFLAVLISTLGSHVAKSAPLRPTEIRQIPEYVCARINYSLTRWEDLRDPVPNFPIRESPRPDSKVLALADFTFFMKKPIKNVNGYYQVETSDRIKGWMEVHSVALVKPYENRRCRPWLLSNGHIGSEYVK